MTREICLCCGGDDAVEDNDGQPADCPACGGLGYFETDDLENQTDGDEQWLENGP